MRTRIFTRLFAASFALMTAPIWGQSLPPANVKGADVAPMGKPQPINTQGVKQQWLDVVYANASPAQKLDIYLPDTGTGPFPVIIAIHGGGFDSGDKRTGEVNPQLTGLSRGYAVVSVNYRLSREAVFPAAIYDIKAAVRFLRANAQQYHLKASRMAAWGDSAGGNLAALLGTSAGVEALENRAMGNAAQPSDVQAVVDFYGPTDFAAMDDQFEQAGITQHMQHGSKDSSESRYMGFAVSSYPDKAKLADPTGYISSHTCPFFIENGTADPVVPAQQHVDLTLALKKVVGTGNVTHMVLYGAGHGGPQFEDPANLDRVFTFLDRNLKYTASEMP